jgi:S-adenosylmethionine-diacylglycerol 3-amino-3-carboxypropyl transferase
MAQTDFWRAGNLGRAELTQDVIFSQVREDTAPERWLLTQLSPNPRAFVIASGGCTALNLLSAGAGSVTACDINPAQIHLLELKKAVLQRLHGTTLLSAFLENADTAYQIVRSALPEATRNFWEAHTPSLGRGLNRTGRLDRQLERAMSLFRIFVHREPTVRRMLDFTDLPAQTAFYKASWDNSRWRFALWLALQRPALRLVYGETILERLPADFAAQLKSQVSAAFTGSPSAENSSLWQSFLPDRLPRSEAQFPFYLRHLERLRPALANLHCVTADAATALEAAEPFDLIALSNILDIVPLEYAERLSAATFHASRPGTFVVLRFFFTPPEALLHAFERRFRLDSELSRGCQERDAGLFCRNSFVFRRDP